MNLAIPNYGWEVVDHCMLLQLRAESIQNKDYFDSFYYQYYVIVQYYGYVEYLQFQELIQLILGCFIVIHFIVAVETGVPGENPRPATTR